MAFETLKTDYQDDVLDTSMNQIRRYVIVNNAGGSISLVDTTTYLKTGTFIGAKDINLICKNMNTIMGFIETSSGDLAQEFQTYFNAQKVLFEAEMNSENDSFVLQFDTYFTNFKDSCSSQFKAWYNSNTSDWSKEVEDRINGIILSVETIVESNGPFVLNYPYIRGALVNYLLESGATRGYMVINNVPADQGITPLNPSYFMEVTREGAQGIGIGLTPRGVWNNYTPYVLNDLVFHKYAYWYCDSPNADSEPSESNIKWVKHWDFTVDLFTGTKEQFNTLESNADNFTITKFQDTVVDGCIPEWKLSGNTIASNSSLMGFTPKRVFSIGKNLFNLQDHISWLIDFGTGVNVVEVNGETQVSLRNYYETEDYTNRYSVSCKANTQYTFSFDTKINGDMGDFIVFYTDNDWDIVDFSNTSFLRKTITSRVGKTVDKISWSFETQTTEYVITIKNFQMEEGTVATTYENYKSSEVNITSGTELHKLPNGISDILYGNGNVFKIIKKYVITSADVISLDTTSTPFNDFVYFNISTLSGMKDYGVSDNIATKLMTTKSTPRNGVVFTNSSVPWKHFITTTNWGMSVPKGTYTSLIQAKGNLSGTEIIFQLANTELSNLNDEFQIDGTLQSYEHGTVYIENIDISIGSLQCDVPTNLAASNKSIIKMISNINKTVSTKINILFTELGNKLNASNVVNNLATTLPGFALDARMGKQLKDEVNTLNTNLTTTTAACTLSSGFTANRNKCIKNHKTVTIEISGSWATPQASGTKFATVPNNYRPNFTDQIRVKTGGSTPGIIYIYSDGNMYFYTDNGGAYPMVDNYIITFVNI